MLISTVQSRKKSSPLKAKNEPEGADGRRALHWSSGFKPLHLTHLTGMFRETK